MKNTRPLEPDQGSEQADAERQDQGDADEHPPDALVVGRDDPFGDAGQRSSRPKVGGCVCSRVDCRHAHPLAP
jgi:hypothetical protein